MAKLLKPVGIALLVFMIAFRPGPTAQVFRNIFDVIGDMADGVGQFVTTVFSG